MERWQIIHASTEAIAGLLGENDPRVSRFRRDVEGDALSRLLEDVLADQSLSVDISSRALWLAPLVPTLSLVEQIVTTLRLRPELAGLAADALHRVRELSTLPELQAILLDRSLSSECRASSARAMAWLFDPNVKASLLQVLNSPNEDTSVLLEVLDALGMSQLYQRATDATEDICRLLLSEVPDIRDAVLTTLGNIGATDAISRIEALVGDAAKTSSGRSVGENAARVLRLLRSDPG